MKSEESSGYTSITKESENPSCYTPTEKTSLLGKNTMTGSASSVGRSFLPIRSFYFFWYGGGAVLDTFFILYFKSLGLTVTDLSIIYIITPILQCSFPIFAGLIADRIGTTKPVLYSTFIVLLIIVNCALLIPNVNSRYEDIHCENSIFAEQQTPSLSCNIQCRLEETRSISCFFGKKTSSYIDDIGDNLQTTLRASYQNHSLNKTINFVVNNVSFSSDCEAKCQWIAPNEIEDNFMMVFISSLIIIIGTNTASAIVYRIIDSAAMSIINTHKADFGFLRAFGMVSMTIFAPVAGFAIDLTTPAGESRNYSMAFYIFDVMTIVAVVSIIRVDIHLTAPSSQLLQKTWTLLKNIDTVAFFLAVTTLGTVNGFTRTFTPLFLEELHAPTMVFSLLTAVLGAVGLPFLMTSNWWIKNLHTTNLFLLAFAGHIIMCVGLSYITNPWWSLLYETATIFTYHLLWVAVVKYSYDIAPEGLTATVVAAAGGIHFGMGRGTGSLIGGLTMDTYGARWAYRLMAILTAAIGVLYAIFLYFRKRSKKSTFYSGFYEEKQKTIAQL